MTEINKSHRVRFSLGFLSGFIANLFIFYWIWATFKAAGVGILTTFNCWVVLSAIMGTYIGLFFLGYGFFKDSRFKPLLAAALWVALDAIKTITFTGFPWALLAHTQTHHTHLIQIASLTGASGVTFLLIVVNVAVEPLIRWQREKGNPRWVIENTIPLLMAFFLVLTSCIWGWIKTRPGSSRESTLKVAVLQGNIDQYQKWDDTYESLIRSRYEDLVAKASEGKPDLIIWPESAVPGWIPGDKTLTEWLQGVIRRSHTAHVVGAVSLRNEKATNSAFLFSSEGEIISVYDKQHLVPFGEYIPFGGIFKKWIPYLGELGSFEAGSRPVDFVIKNKELLIEPHLSPNVCFEAIFPNLVRSNLNEQTHVIVNLTNDGWYLNSGAPEQHYVANIFRAVENGLPLIRAANTGISALIDSYGKEIIRTKLMRADVLVGNIPFGNTENERGTPFRKFGAWFEVFCWILLGVWLIGLIKRKNETTKGWNHTGKPVVPLLNTRHRPP